MGLVALADFGSTYTKVSLVDAAEGKLVARGEAPTSVGTDLMNGYEAALAEARGALGEPFGLEAELAASSAGGGLRVAAVGLVEDLTAAAARQAALNAGARVEAVVAGLLTDAQLEDLVAARPEIVLFAGGTDGGQAELVLENARRLASRRIGDNVVVACNAEVAAEAAELIRGGGTVAEIAANVMPQLGRLEIGPARKAILAIFLEHVIGGKGLSASRAFERMVKMPTPEAVLEATSLLARGTPTQPGVGDLVVIDVGGATTDVHSERVAEVASPGVDDPLLPPPASIRTVEGDLGLRSGAAGAVAVDGRWIEAETGIGRESVRQDVSTRSGDPAWVPADERGLWLDRVLAVSCTAQALTRHCGSMLLRRGEGGTPTLVRDGPDLREVGTILGTGGVFAHRDDGAEVLARALARQPRRTLSPRHAEPGVDANYVMAAAGLLSTRDREAAMRLLRAELSHLDKWTT